MSSLVSYLRRRGEEPASAVAEYHLTRNNQPIGDEFFVGFHLPQQLASYLQERSRDDPVTDADLDQLSVEGGMMPANLRRVLPFEALETTHVNPLAGLAPIPRGRCIAAVGGSGGKCK